MAGTRYVSLLLHGGGGREGGRAAPQVAEKGSGSEPVPAAWDVALQLVPSILQIHIVVGIHALFIALRSKIASSADLYTGLCATFSLGAAALAADGSYHAASLAALLSITLAGSPILQSLTQVRAAPVSPAARLTPRRQDYTVDTILYLSGSLGILHLLTLPPAHRGRAMCVAAGAPPPGAALTLRRSVLSPLPTNAAAGCVFVLSSHLGDAVRGAGFTALALSLLLFAWPALCALARRLAGPSPPQDAAGPVASASAAGASCAALCLAVALVAPALAGGLLLLSLALLVATPLVVKALWPIREHDAPLSATYAQR